MTFEEELREDYDNNCFCDIVNTINKYKLDKEKVRQAIEKVEDLWNHKTGVDWVEELEKELGLSGSSGKDKNDNIIK